MGTIGKEAAVGSLPASTLVEAIVASVIFLAVFAISLNTVTRLTTGEKDYITMVEVDYAIKSCFREYSGGGHLPGKYNKTYDWGEITIEINPYGNYPELQQLMISADIHNRNKYMEYRHIIHMADE